MSAKRYELTTLEDVWNKIPSDRIMDCLSELGKLMQTTKATVEMLVAVSNAPEAANLKPIPDDALRLKYPLIWIDDDKGHLQTNFVVGGEKLMHVRITKDKP